MNSAFRTYHPAVTFLYFAAVISLTVFLTHPVFLCTGFIFSLVLAAMLAGGQAGKLALAFGMPMVLLLTAVNAVFNLRGATILFYLGRRNITLESAAFGFCSAVALLTVVLWFAGYNKVMTSDKFLYLFGKLSPSAALLVSMTLGLVPKLKHRLLAISDAQKTVGCDISCGNALARARNGMQILSVLTTWSLEDAIETVNAMNARGYGTAVRTSFSVFRFSRRDLAAMLLMMFLIVACIALMFAGGAGFAFFPALSPAALSTQGAALLICYTVLCAFPLIIEGWEVIRWQYLK